MNLWQRIGNFLRQHLSEPALSRLARRSGIAADRAIEQAMERVPLLRKLDEIAPPQEELDLLHTTVEHMPGKQWLNKISDQAERMEPSKYGPPGQRNR